MREDADDAYERHVDFHTEQQNLDQQVMEALQAALYRQHDWRPKVKAAIERLEGWVA